MRQRLIVATALMLLQPGGFLRGQVSPSSSERPLQVCSGKILPPCADKPPIATYAPDPEYPKEAQKAKVEGTVVLGAVVGLDGRARNIRVIKSVGHGLDEEAISTVKKWKFKPGESAGTPVPVLVNVQVAFLYPWK